MRIGLLNFLSTLILAAAPCFAQSTISTVAGNAKCCNSPDGGQATSSWLASTVGITVDKFGNLYILEAAANRVRKVDANGVITTVAGNGTTGYSGDGGPATSAQINPNPNHSGMAIDAQGNLYICDTGSNVVRKVNAAGIISTFAGTGVAGFSGDDGPAASAQLDTPLAIALDKDGNLYIADSRNNRIRKVNTTGIISTVAGSGASSYTGDGVQATDAGVDRPEGVSVDIFGSIYVSETSSSRVRKVSPTGIISTIAGQIKKTTGFSGDGGPGVAATLYGPIGLAVDPSGNLFIADNGNNRVRKLDAAGIITTYAGNGGGTASTPLGDGGPATSAYIGVGKDVALDAAGNLYISGIAGGIARVRKVTNAGSPSFASGTVVNAAGYQTKLAPGAVFVVFGSGLGPASLTTGTGPNYPASLSGTSITFTPASGGTPINAKIVYTSAGQVAGLLPSSIAAGTYAVRVAYAGLTSLPQNVAVVARSFGIATANSAGTGTAQATIGNVNGGISLVRFTTGSVSFGGHVWILTPAHPGDTLVLWGTGGGADSANDTGGSSGDQTSAGNFKVTVGSRQMTPLYAGASSGYAGLWQINFKLPADIAPDCQVPLQVTAGGELSNAVTIPIAVTGQSSCPNVPH